MIFFFFLLLFSFSSEEQSQGNGGRVERKSLCETRAPPYSCARNETGGGAEVEERINEHD